MSRMNRTQKAAGSVQDRAREAAAKLKPAADQVKPLARSTQEAAQRGLHAGRAWAAPRVERTGHMLQDSVAPKVADMLSSAARRIEPEKARSRRWWTLPGILVLVAAGASAAAAALRKRSTQRAAEPAAGADSAGADSGEADSGEAAGAAGEVKASANTDAAGAARKS
jgi:hypothetical protein